MGKLKKVVHSMDTVFIPRSSGRKYGFGSILGGGYGVGCGYGSGYYPDEDDFDILAEGYGFGTAYLNDNSSGTYYYGGENGTEGNGYGR